MGIGSGPALSEGFLVKTQPATPSFQQLLTWVMTEVIYGRAHFAIVLGLRRADPVVLETAPRFFALTLDAHADLAIMAAARIFDEDPRSVSIHSVLSACSRDAGLLSPTAEDEVRRVVAEAKDFVRTLKPILKPIRLRRNQTVAHSDTQPLADPGGYIKGGRLKFRELDDLFEKTAQILNRLAEVHCLNTPSLHLPDANDYERALDLIADAKCEQARRYEAERDTPVPFPKPKKCS